MVRLSLLAGHGRVEVPGEAVLSCARTGVLGTFHGGKVDVDQTPLPFGL